MDEEVTLRPCDLADVDDLYEYASEDKVSAWCRWDTYTNKEDLLNYMKTCMIPHPWMRVICYRGRPVGSISVTPYTGADRCRAELGYVMASQYWGKGIATKAVKLTLETVFKDLKDLERVEALVDVENFGSQKVLEKSGFTKDGVLRRFWIHKGHLCHELGKLRYLYLEFKINVTPYPGSDRCRAELGYVLASQYWGKGIATKAVKLTLETVFKDLKDLERVEALVDVENFGSQKVLEKSGFTKDGVLRRFSIHKGMVRDRILYSFISTDPLV
ncbi:Acyl-CoA N-acyltransferases (NAT) superfamily protein [Rhynchospora pubera]|uniref:Acyl-CoA N-acyltransferases (NAT) superfamily protein n=1 Tax=Rhynchospora pubera TaxID=906938 RepID=A0AAV8BSF2_9POAL|nr:Acyl-CoA N-acyltransferases (NAT) superfamily protein [Rhynchospora pubera]